MFRFAIVVGWGFCCSVANGFPAPKPNEPATNAVMIAGVWEVVKVNGALLVQPVYWEFRASGEFVAFLAAGRLGQPSQTPTTYAVKGDSLEIARKGGSELTELTIKCLNDRDLIVGPYHLRRK